MTRARLYALAILAATLSTAGDYVGFRATRSARPWSLVLLCELLWVPLSPLWYLMAREAGFVDAGATWATFAAILSVVLAVVVGEPQSSGEWLGFGLIAVGALVRGVSR